MARVGAGATVDVAQRPTWTRPGWGDDRARAALVVLTAFAAVVRFLDIGHQGFWFDEANTALLVHFSPGRMLGLIPHSESTPPLYYLIAWTWARLFGSGEAGLRSLSAVAGVATVPVLFAAGRHAIGPRAGLLAATLAATNPLLVWYSQEARSYSLLVLLCALTLLAALRLGEAPTRRAAVLWGAAGALALGTHYYAVLAVAPEAVWLLVRRRRDRTVCAAIAVVAACGLALVPLAIQQQGTGNTRWIASAALGRRLSQVVPQFLAGFPAPGQAVLVPIAGALLAVAIVLAAWRGESATRRWMIGFAGLAFAGLVIILGLVAAGTDDLLTRNLLPVWPAAALAVAVACAERRARWLAIPAVVVLCAVGVSGALAVDVDRDLQRPDWRAVARALGTRPAGGGERLLLVQHYRDLLPLRLYLPGLHWVRHAGASVREIDVVGFTDPASGGFCWWGSACNLDPSAMQPRYAIAGFREASRRHVFRFTVVRLESARTRRVTPREVARALTTTTLRRDELLVQR